MPSGDKKKPVTCLEHVGNHRLVISHLLMLQALVIMVENVWPYVNSTSGLILSSHVPDESCSA